MDNFKSYITGKPLELPSLCCKAFENRREITNMLENALQGIACDFDTSQGLKNFSAQVCGIAACGWALS